MYAPDSASGRRGLLELRAFEMPPHAHMSLAQQLLLRALVARFWREPYTARLVRWGTELQDRFMLPHFVWLDFEDVVEEFGRAGYPIDAAWFLPHYEFKFPVAGEVAVRAVELTLRQALEPWPVLGEESSAGGTARYVDSSLERLQVHVSGLTSDRFIVACNGRAVPLQPTGRNGEYVGGVRYRAWQPASALHPTIAPHAPLTFDIVDTWMDRSLGGCQYHVMHPGGRSHDQFPVNSYEAESRRLAGSRAWATRRDPPRGSCRASREFPYTLDLRVTMQDPLLNNYAVPAGHFDELLDAGGAPRDWWASLAAHADLSAAHLASAQARVSRQMHENGVTYNVYAAADGPNRPWTLDVLPFVVQAGEWASLESGLRQRARLLNALAADLYGPQRVLHEGVIPPALVFKHPGYLRACHGISPQGGLFVHLVAFDLARDPDGRWRVVNTRTQAPSGAGYALENRATIPRVFPGAFRV
jgi:hypothetical protein